MCNPAHSFYPNALKRYALGTKNKLLKTTTMATWPSISGTSRLLPGGRKGLWATVRGLALLGCRRPPHLRSVSSLLEINCHSLSVGSVLHGHVLGLVHNQGEFSGNRLLLAVSDG